MMEKAVKTRIFGRVQGVWYRGWTRDQATALGLKGWVRNCPDGTVEAVFAGPADAIDRMLALCREGPRGAHVVDIEINAAEETSDIKGFEIRR